MNFEDKLLLFNMTSITKICFARLTIIINQLLVLVFPFYTVLNFNFNKLQNKKQKIIP